MLLPQFTKIDSKTIQINVDNAINYCKEVIEKALENNTYTWDNLLAPIEDADDKLQKLWSPIAHMNAVVSTPELRLEHDSCIPKLSEYATYVGQHQRLYAAILSIKKSSDYEKLSVAKQTAIDNHILDFKLSGVALDAKKQKEFAQISMQLSELGSKFANNILDATNAWDKHITNAKDLEGVPESVLDAAAMKAIEKDKNGWLFTLDIPSYLPIMMYCENRELREEFYTAFATRASDKGPFANNFDNSSIINEILKLRNNEANLLGYANYAEKSLVTKMAQTKDQVFDLLSQLSSHSKACAQKDYEEVVLLAKEYGVTDLKSWDLAFYSEKLKQKKYSISSEELRPYFPCEQVLDGLFFTVNKLFNISIDEQYEFDKWHPDVRFFSIKNSSNTVIGGFYLDLYARANKQGGAWMDAYCSKRKSSDKEQLPIAYLTCNFSSPTSNKPALFTHEEVTTLFHEFGHGLHHMLTKIDIAAVSGINGVAWDAVELPSQFLENFCWQEEALVKISGHYETKQPLPKELLDKMLAAKNFQSGLQMLRQVEFAMFDFKIHSEYKEDINVLDELDAIRKKVAVVIPPSWARFPHSFSHIFAGGYAAGYYSYKWAEVLSADAFSLFEENGIFDLKTGVSFLENILEMGGSQDALTLFKNFRGREPKIDALLKHSGII